MSLFESIRSWFGSGEQVDSNGRVKCKRCRNRILQATATDNDGLCGVCFRKHRPKPKPAADKPSAYHQKLETPVEQLTDKEKKLQLSGAITWKNEKRIDEVLAAAPDIVEKKPSYTDKTWLGYAVSHDCEIKILEKLVKAGCQVNASPDANSQPLELAISKDKIEVVQWLLDRGADPNLGRPIVGAINHRKTADVQLALLELLLAAGCDINRSFDLFGDENQRFSVLDWAEMYSISQEVIDFLKSNGAKKLWSDETTRKNKNELGTQRIVR